ncbi:hypothetical protein B0T26DRAFT_678207 [Lasiosphaeria miniovina]|uniref:Tyrosinase C-terminal domain-containing protein n=1 Tax=Lasiosphaeria miniovina TaxID=1954250 RepID=A0AA40DUJ5_9PEZI|nr:uncharacterized protein B0T26DRAFT_678207 [Lasiosphaeria miniovina]KAK0713932.1 hypothetical protein B0T26DRAFT_678207 [Lasiosphaeria miniovina]
MVPQSLDPSGYYPIAFMASHMSLGMNLKRATKIIDEYMKDYAVNNFTGNDLQDLKAVDEWHLTDKEKPWEYNIPQAFEEANKKVEIRISSGSGKTDDGLYRFRMPEDMTMGDKKLPKNLRITSYSDEVTVKTGVMNEGLRDAYHRLFPIAKFQDFASTEFTGKKNVYANCEALRNKMHRWCGEPPAPKDGDTVSQLGHMPAVVVAAFGPYFGFITGYTYLIPDKQPYIADGVYDRQAYLEAIKSELTDKYNAARNAAEKSVISADPGDTDGGTFDDYAVNVAYGKMALGGRQFTVYIFVGKVPSTLPYDVHGPKGSLVGQVVSFTSLATEAGGGGQGCTKCTQQAVDRTQATGRVVLTNGLITRWKQQLVHTPRSSTSSSGGSPPPAALASMSPVDLVHFLEANLHWRVTTDDDGLLVDDLEAVLPSLKVSLVAGKAQHFPEPAELSRLWDFRPAYQVTAGRPGGAKREDSLYPAGEEWQAEA